MTDGLIDVSHQPGRAQVGVRRTGGLGKKEVGRIVDTIGRIRPRKLGCFVVILITGTGEK